MRKNNEVLNLQQRILNISIKKRFVITPNGSFLPFHISITVKIFHKIKLGQKEFLI